MEISIHTVSACMTGKCHESNCGGCQTGRLTSIYFPGKCVTQTAKQVGESGTKFIGVLTTTGTAQHAQ